MIKKIALFLFKALLLVGGVLAGLAAVVAVVFFLSVRPKELPLKEAWQYVGFEREEGDEMIHAYTGIRWLDSQRYFVIKADPSKFDERVKRLTEKNWGAPGAKNAWSVQVREGPGKDLWHRGERLPSWWDVDSLRNAVAADVGPRVGHHGFTGIFAKERGLIYIIDR